MVEKCNSNYYSPTGPSENTTWSEWSEHCFTHDQFTPKAEENVRTGKGPDLDQDEGQPDNLKAETAGKGIPD